MSTVIKYKGNTIAVADNDTRTLLTNGKWIENNIEITSQTPTTATVAVTDTVDPAGGTVREITTGTAASDDVTYTTVNYNNATVASFHSDTTKSLRTGGTFAESDFEVVSDEPDTMSYEVTDTLDVKEGTIRDIKVTSMLNRFFDLNYPNGNVVTTVSEVCDYVAYGRTGIKNLYAPNLTRVKANSFYTSKIEGVYLPNCTDISDNCFRDTDELSYIYAPELQIVGASVFMGNKGIKTLVFPHFNTCYSNGFQSMSALEGVDFGNSTTNITNGFFRPTIFRYSSLLSIIILRSPNVVTLHNSTDIFAGTPFANGGSGGKIYVPAALIDSYKAASNWSVYDSYGTITWLPIEGSEYENKYIDGTTFEEYQNIQPPFEDIKNADWLFDYKAYPKGKVVSTKEFFAYDVIRGRESVTELYLPNAKTIQSYAFSFLPNLKNIYCPNYLGEAWSSYSFSYNDKLEVAVLPKWETMMHNGIFYQCPKLQIVDMLGCYSDPRNYCGFNQNVFLGCSSLSILIIRANGVVPVNKINVFEGTPFAEGGAGGTVYVPSALIEDYKIATNWSTLFGYGTVTFLPIEGSQYEHYYANGTPIEEE